MPVIEIFLFGPPRLERSGLPVALGRSRALALLAYLCCSRGPQSRDVLIEILWPLFTPEDARNNLRRELSLLRNLLPEGVLVTDRQNAGLNQSGLADGVWGVDVLSFGSDIRRAEAHAHQNRQLCDECAGYLERAVGLYTADFLAGFSLPDSSAFDEWQFQVSNRLQISYRDALGRLGDWHETRGDLDRALSLVRRRAAVDPLDEDAQRELMRLYEENGQHTNALRHYELTRQTLQDELGIEPQAETVELFHAIREKRFLSEAAKIETIPISSNNLPADTTPFIGRVNELGELAGLLTDPKARLVTLLGIGGMGKTRLAIATARQIASSTSSTLFRDGIFFAPLSPLTSSAEIPAAIALSLGYTLGSDGSATQQLYEFLRTRHALIIVDNVEHLIDHESASLFDGLLSHCPGVKLLATSRIRLGLSGEHLFPLSGLDLPSGDGLSSDQTLGDDGRLGAAVALFVESARRIKPSFHLDASTIPTVVEICRLVGGLPLGIELAAGWIELLTPDAIREEINCSLDFLESDLNDLPSRQSSLKAVFDSSWKMLTTEEQQVLPRLTIFPSSFDRHAAEAVAKTSLRTLLSLVNKSWLQPAEENRFRIHEMLRQYAAQIFVDDPQVLLERHAMHYADFMASLESGIRDSRQNTDFERVTGELDNIRMAMMWLINANRFDTLVNKMGLSLYRYLESHYRYFLFDGIIVEAARQADSRRFRREKGILLAFRTAFFFNGYPTRFMDYHWVGAVMPELMRASWDHLPEPGDVPDLWDIILAWQYGRFVNVEIAVQRLKTVIQKLAMSGRRWDEAFARQSLGRLLSRRPWDAIRFGGEGEAQKSLVAAWGIFEALGDKREAAITLLFMGFERQSEGDFVEAKRLILQAQEQLRALGESIIAVNANWQLGEIHMQLGEVEESFRYFHEMADILLRHGRANLATASLSRESYEAVRYGDLDYALSLRKRSLALSRQTGERYNEGWDCWEMGETYRVMGRLDEARRWYEHARAVFESISNNDVQSFYYRGLGDLALAAQDYGRAKANFLCSIRWAEDTEHPWQQAYALTGLGKSLVGLGRLDKARSAFQKALEVGMPTGDSGGLILATFFGIAQFLKSKELPERATELASTILKHSLAWQETRQAAAKLIGLAPEKIPSRAKTSIFDLSPIANDLLVTALRDE